jgi:Uma2 family endonuclease
MTRAATTIGPADNGRRMTLDEFDTAEGSENRVYELSRGVIVVTDVPNPSHGDTVDEGKQQFAAYRVSHPGVIKRIHGGSDCKLLIAETESERHPDIAVYKTPRPGDDSSVWADWVPEIVVEVVSVDSRKRDYEEKPDDYRAFGVQEYWIIDALEGRVRIHRRRKGQWVVKDLFPGDKYVTHVLPGFELDVAAVLSA